MAVQDVIGLTSLVDSATFVAITAEFKRPHEDEAIVTAWSTSYGGIASNYEPREHGASKMARRMAIPCALRGLLWFKLSGGEHRHLAEPRSYHRAFQGTLQLECSAVVQSVYMYYYFAWCPLKVTQAAHLAQPVHSS
jgi:hypothetical protein